MRTSSTRVVVYLGALLLVPTAAFMAGMAHFAHVSCTGTGGECDLAGLEGMVWAAVALVVVVVAVVVAELRRRVGRRGGPEPQPSDVP